MYTLTNKGENPHRPRKGAALIELAICLPVFFMITMASIETCRMIYVRQSLKIAAYECARLAIIPKIDHQTLQDQCDAILVGRRIRGYTFTCEPYDPQTLQFGQLFKATVQAPAEANNLMGTWFYRNSTFNESVTIMAEY